MDTWKAVKSLNIKGANEIINKAYVVFYRLYKEDWGYMGMRDYPTDEPTNEYQVCVVHYSPYTGWANITDAGILGNTIRTKSIDKDMANLIWYNLKNGKDYNQLYEFCKAHDLIR